MTNTLYRYFSLLICLCLLCGVVSARGEESNFDDDIGISEEQFAAFEEEYRYADRFGIGVKVEEDGDGNPVTVNGYPTKQVRAGFNNLGQNESFQMEVDFVDYPFWQSAAQYDGNLAVMSLIMAGCANRAIGFHDIPEEDFDPSLNVVHFLSDAGFTDIRKDDYSKIPSMFTVSTAMGHRLMTHEGEDPFTLIAIGVCGEGYKNEWESNMTAGTGEIHEGFQSAAQLVIDRLAGYIATRNIQGNVKVWISGFSRAAAISNVVAGTLVNTGFLPKENVYAYTFATPAAIRNPPQEGYENIFNIINSADLIPQVMPAEWGYGRYGSDRFLPIPEFSSYTGFINGFLKSYSNKELYHVEYNYSSALTLRTRLLMSLFLDLISDAENYVANFQPSLVNLMHDKTISNTVSILQDLMQNIKLRDRQDQKRFDDLIDYFLRAFSGIALRSGYQEADSNTGSVMSRFMVEHTPNAYFSAINSIRDGNFEGGDQCCYVMVRGPVTLALYDASNDLDVLSVLSDGTVSFSEAFKEFEAFRGLFYTERIGGTTVIGVPMDSDYRVFWTAEKDGTVECVQAITYLWAGSRFPGAASGKLQVKAGDTGLAFQNSGYETILPEGFTDTVFSARTLAGFMGIVSLGLNWRVSMTLLFALLGFMICIPLCLIASRKPTRRKRYSFLTWACLCLLGVAALEAEIAFWFFADQLWIRIAWKVVAALCFIALFFLLHQNEKKLSRSFFPSIVLAVMADVVISIHFIAGVILFLLCHISLAYQFLRNASMSKGKWIQWAVVSSVLVAMIILFYVPDHGAVGWSVAIYAPVLLLMTFSAANNPVRVRVSAIMFLISDALLGLYGTLMSAPIIHVVYMFLFYLALLILTIYTTDSSDMPVSGTLRSEKAMLEGYEA